ncbi:MAG: hypothetical protein QXN93_05405 [Methanomassiliicoccales archaeon]
MNEYVALMIIKRNVHVLTNLAVERDSVANAFDITGKIGSFRAVYSLRKSNALTIDLSSAS